MELTTKKTTMLNVLNLSKLQAYSSEFMTGVRVWQANNYSNGASPNEEYKEHWDYAKFQELHRKRCLTDEQLDVITGLYHALSFKPDRSIVTLYTRKGDWQDSQVYAPIIQWADKEQTKMVLNIGGEHRPLEVSQGKDAHDVPQIWLKAMLCDEVNGPLAPNCKALNTQNMRVKFRGDDGKDVEVDRLVGLLPVSADRRKLVQIPFHPAADFYKSNNIYQAYQTGDYDTFWQTCLKELSIAGTGGQSGPIADVNRIFRGRTRGQLLAEFAAKHGGLPVKCETFRFIPGEYPAIAFKADLSLVIKLWGDEIVEGWGKKPKPQYKLSEIVWVSISTNNRLVAGFVTMQPQPVLLLFKGPNPKNYDFIPQMEVLPISSFSPDKQQKLFGSVFTPAALPAAPVQPVIEPVTEVVDASLVF